MSRTTYNYSRKAKVATRELLVGNKDLAQQFIARIEEAAKSDNADEIRKIMREVRQAI